MGCVLKCRLCPSLQSLRQLLSLPLSSDCCAVGHQTSKIKRELLAYLTQEWDHKVQEPLSCSLPPPLMKRFQGHWALDMQALVQAVTQISTCL